MQPEILSAGRPAHRLSRPAAGAAGAAADAARCSGVVAAPSNIRSRHRNPVHRMPVAAAAASDSPQWGSSSSSSSSSLREETVACLLTPGAPSSTSSQRRWRPRVTYHHQQRHTLCCAHAHGGSNGGSSSSSTPATGTALANAADAGASSSISAAVATTDTTTISSPNPGVATPQQQQPSTPVPATQQQQAVPLQPVTFTQTIVLPPAATWHQAAAALRAAIAAALPRLAPLSSGVVRWEVPLPRGCSAARWLRGQDDAAHHQVYFSGRHSTAPETPKSSLAEACARGWTAAAGLGAAWLWRGAPGVVFGERQLTGVQRMLSEAQPRIRVLGGTRFDAQQAPAAEWAPFGSFCFLLPQVEYLEAANCTLLSLNLAWDGRYALQREEDASCSIGEGPATAAAAAEQAAALLAALAPPASPSAPAPAPAAGKATHTPAKGAWHEAVTNALDVLQSDDAARFRPAFGLAALDPEMAKQEFINGGQQGLDDLLEALAGSRAAAAEGGEGGGSSSSGRSGAGGGEEAPSSISSSGSSLAAATTGSSASSPASSSGAPAGSAHPASSARAAPEDAEDPIIKLVLARRSAWPLARPMAGVALLEALQERDPRAYQIYLSVPGEPLRLIRLIRSTCSV